MNGLFRISLCSLLAACSAISAMAPLGADASQRAEVAPPGAAVDATADEGDVKESPEEETKRLRAEALSRWPKSTPRLGARVLAGLQLQREKRGGWSLVYRVARGDTLGKIAQRVGQPIEKLVVANGLRSRNLVRVGQRLTIPSEWDSLDPAVLARMPARIRDDHSKLQLALEFDRWARSYDLPPDLLKAIGWVESRWNWEAFSVKGAIGIGQLMPDTVDFVSGSLLRRRMNPWEPEHNIQMSARFLRYLLEKTQNDHEKAVAAYYQGLGALQRRGILGVSKPYVSSVFEARNLFRAEDLDRASEESTKKAGAKS